MKKMPAPTGYINDYANVLTSEAQSDMETLCREVHDKTKAQVFVVTINSLDGSSVEEFSNQLFHQWKIGEKKTDRGVLLLLAIKDHKYRIEVGYGLEGILNDAKAGDIGRDMVSFLRADDYSAAANSSLRAVSKIIADDSHVTLDALQQNPEPFNGTPTSAPTPDENQNAHVKLYVTLLVCAWFSIFGLVIVLIRRGNKKGWSSGSGSSSGGSFWSSSGGSSSDDDSFSGGDGGDSGGGGASGSW
jgi:uncharacterized protein